MITEFVALIDASLFVIIRLFAVRSEYASGIVVKNKIIKKKILVLLSSYFVTLTNTSVGVTINFVPPLG